MNAKSVLFLILSSGLLCACTATPVAPDDMPPALQRIDEVYRGVVEEAYADPEVEWENGWYGNYLVHLDRDKRRGLCWEWQELVFARVHPIATQVGWGIVGITINNGSFSEHHAVVVYDRARASQDDILRDDGSPHAWVLDAWANGRAEIFRVSEWIDNPLIVFSDPWLTDLTYLFDENRDAGDPLPE